MADNVIQVMGDVSDVIPPLIPSVNETIEQGEAVKEKAEEVIEYFEDTLAKAKERFEQVEEAMEAFAQEREQSLQELSAAIEDLEKTAMEKLEQEIAKSIEMMIFGAATSAALAPYIPILAACKGVASTINTLLHAI